MPCKLRSNRVAISVPLSIPKKLLRKLFLLPKANGIRLWRLTVAMVILGQLLATHTEISPFRRGSGFPSSPADGFKVISRKPEQDCVEEGPERETYAGQMNQTLAPLV